jgi:hypothetical protein
MVRIRVCFNIRSVISGLNLGSNHKRLFMRSVISDLNLGFELKFDSNLEVYKIC